MRLLGGLSVALIVVALAATGATAQGCGGSGETPAVKKAVETTAEGGVTAGVQSASGKAALQMLEKKAQALAKHLRQLEEAGKTDEARQLAASLKQLKVEMVNLKRLVKSGAQVSAVVEVGGSEDAPGRGVQLSGRVIAGGGEEVPGGVIRLIAGGDDEEGEEDEESEAGETASAPAGGFLGVQMEDTEGAGVRIAQVVPGSPAERAGLKAGDVISAVNGKKVGSAEQLAGMIGSNPPGTSVKIELRRGELTAYYQVKLGTRPAMVAEEEEGEEVQAPTPALPRLTSALARPTPAPEAVRERAVTVRSDLGGALASAPLAQQEQVVAQLNAHLQAIRARAQQALAAGQYGSVAELAQAANQVAQKIEEEGKRLVDMRARQADEARRAAAQSEGARRAALLALVTQAGQAPQDADAQRLSRLERRLMNMENRLGRIEKLLEKLARD